MGGSRPSIPPRTTALDYCGLACVLGVLPWHYERAKKEKMYKRTKRKLNDGKIQKANSLGELNGLDMREKRNQGAERKIKGN